MDLSDTDRRAAEQNMETVRSGGYALSASFDAIRRRIIVGLNTGVEISFPPELAEGLGEASDTALSDIEISPSGLGLHWPQLDADLYVPTLLQGLTGSRKWMAARLGAGGGKVRSPAKAASARENGRKGGRPRKVVAASGS